jgi:hypothetical protein
MSYLNKLKIAVINEDINKLEELVNESPEYDSIEEAQEIVSFIKEAVKLLQKEKNKISLEMQKIKKLQKFNIEKRMEKESFSFKA